MTRIARSPVRKRQAKFKIACAFRPLSPCGIPCGIFSTGRAPMGRFWIAARLRLSAFFSSACAREFFRPLPVRNARLPRQFFPARPFRKKTAPNSVSVWNAKKSFKIRISSADFQQFTKTFQYPKKFPKVPRFQNPHSSFSKLSNQYFKHLKHRQAERPCVRNSL